MDDVVVVGGGIIGASTAYFLSKEGRKVRVIERDPTYKKASFPLSLGGFRRQFFQKENINLGKFALEFISNISNTLKTKNNPNPTASMVPNGYLLLFGPEHAEEQYEALKNHKACDAGTKNIPASKLKEIFSWINPEGLETATYTDNKIEGWIDPYMFHNALKNKAIELGAKFEKGEVKKISDIKINDILSNGEKVLGIVKIDGRKISHLKEYQFKDKNIKCGPNLQIVNNLGNVSTHNIIGKNIRPQKYLYNIITDTKSFYIGSTKFLDYNGSLEVLDIF